MITIGKSVKRVDALGKVTGETVYPGDIDIDGQLYMKMRFSDRAHARVRAVETSRAEQLSGVIAVFTAKDVPVNEYGLITKDQPVMCGPDSSNPHGDVVRCYADCIAVVVAESPRIAQEAVNLITVEYEDLPAVFDPEFAMLDESPQLHADHPNNVLCQYRIRKGDMAKGWALADVVIEGTYESSWQEHAYLQPEAGVSYIDEEGRITVVVAGQWVHEDLWQIMHALDLPEEKVRVIYPAVGGAFGGREDMSVQIVLALATMRLQRPVKIIWSREESILYHHKRHPFRIWSKWGATRDGKIVAMEARVVGDAGAYNYTSTKVVANAALCVTGPYEVEHVHVDTYGVYTNNIPCGAFRGFGAPQAAIAAEGQMNKLANALGIDPVELRLRNALHEGSILSVNTVMPAGVTMPEVIEACASESYWRNGDHNWERITLEQPLETEKRRGVGFACGFKNIGYAFGFPEHSWAIVELYGGSEIEKVIVRQNGAEVGQGAHTAFTQMTAHALGVPIEKVQLIGHDTSTVGSSGSASASRLTFMAGNSIIGAAERALKAWENEERPAIGKYEYRPPATTMFDPETGECDPNFAYAYAAEAVEIELDIETGQLEIIRVVSTNDVGKAINPQLIEGQIEGAVVQAQGYTMLEKLVSVEGRILNPFLSTYLIPTVLDIPREVKSVILELADPRGPWGVRGVAEMPLLPLAPAIIAAIYDATGVWIDQIPLTPDVVVKALREHGIGMV